MNFTIVVSMYVGTYSYPRMLHTREDVLLQPLRSKAKCTKSLRQTNVAKNFSFLTAEEISLRNFNGKLLEICYVDFISCQKAKLLATLGNFCGGVRCYTEQAFKTKQLSRFKVYFEQTLVILIPWMNNTMHYLLVLECQMLYRPKDQLWSIGRCPSLVLGMYLYVTKR